MPCHHQTEQGGQVLITAAKGRFVHSSVVPHRTERGACGEHWTSITYRTNTGYVWLCLQVKASWENLRALIAVGAAGLLFRERFLSFSEGILTQFLKQ